jgi:uncharacterized protein YwgA
MSGIEHADLVLLVLGAPTRDPDQDGKCRGITRLEKLTYLLEAESGLWNVARETPEHFNFKAYHYGPYTRELYDAVDLLVGIGLVNERRSHVGTSLDLAEELESLEPRDLGVVGVSGDERYVEREFELSDKGRYISDVLAKRVGDDAVAEISKIKDHYGRMPLRQLLRDVYAQHPDMTVRSKIKDKL